MKTLQNPTTFFFNQAQNVSAQVSPQINDFVSRLLTKDSCELCKQNYDILTRIPRIMIHCGHTFCTPCLKKFYMNRRVRCPMCLKLVKQLDKLERLPINHTIYTYLVEKDKQICEKSNIKPLVLDAGKALYAQFQKSQKQAHMKQKPQKIDPDSGLPFCVFHNDRVEHFYCTSHSSAGCRVCIEIGHSKPDCKVVDLYEIDDPAKLQQMVNANQYEQESYVEGYIPSGENLKLESEKDFINSNNHNNQKIKKLIKLDDLSDLQNIQNDGEDDQDQDQDDDDDQEEIQDDQ